jgi:hypothetical protein
MIRKQTWAVVIVFAAVLGGVLWMRGNSAATSGGADATHTPTAQPNLLDGWQTGEITWLRLENSAGIVELRETDGQWWLEGEQPAVVGLGKVEQLRAQILDARVITSLSSGYDLGALGLAAPVHTLRLRSAQGREAAISIGSQTPTASGYYVQVDGQSPVVISRLAMEAVLEQMRIENLVEATPSLPGGENSATPQPETTQ